MESEKALAQTRNRVTGSSNRQPGHQTGNQVMKEVTASVGVKEYGERFCGDRWHIDGPSGGLHAYIDEVLSAAPPDAEGSTLQAHFAPPRWRMPPPLSYAGFRTPQEPGTWNLARNMYASQPLMLPPETCNWNFGTLEPPQSHGPRRGTWNLGT